MGCPFFDVIVYLSRYCKSKLGFCGDFGVFLIVMV
jgi:hypothetical protein